VFEFKQQTNNHSLQKSGRRILDVTKLKTVIPFSPISLKNGISKFYKYHENCIKSSVEK